MGIEPERQGWQGWGQRGNRPAAQRRLDRTRLPGLLCGVACLFWISWFSWPVGAQELTAGGVGNPLTFSAAFDLLTRQNERLAAERQLLGQAQAEWEQARGRRLPELGVSAGYVRLQDPIAIDLAPVRRILQQIDPQLPLGNLPGDIEVQKRELFSSSATLRWPVYTGGRITAGIDAAEAARSASQAGFESAEGSLRLSLVERYFAQVLAVRAHQVRVATVETLEDHLRRSRRLYEEGQIARAEVLRAEVALSEARVEQESARHDLELARSALAALLASDEGFEVVTLLPAPPALPLLEPLLSTALGSNPDLRAAREQHARAEAGVRAARGERLPTVAVFGQRELYTRHLDLFSSEWIAGVTVSWSLFGGGDHRSRIDAARLRADEVSYRLAAGQRDLELLIRQRHNRLADALSRLQSFDTLRALAEESLRAQRRAFEEGFASSLDVVDAELALQRVELGTLAANYDSLVALSGLYEAAGQSARMGALFAGGNGQEQL